MSNRNNDNYMAPQAPAENFSLIVYYPFTLYYFNVFHFLSKVVREHRKRAV